MVLLIYFDHAINRQKLLINGTESAWKGVWKQVPEDSILVLSCSPFFQFVDEDTQVGGIAYLVGRSMFKTTQNEARI